MLATVSCGGGGSSSSDDTTTFVSDEASAVGYDYQGKDFGGEDFTMFNLNALWGNYIHLDFEEQTGEQLDDAVYARNRYVEGKLNFTLKSNIFACATDDRASFEQACDKVIQSIMAEDDDFDAAFIPAKYRPDLLTDNYLMDLTEIPELHLYEDYWDVLVNTEMTVNDKLYVAAGPLNMMTTHSSWINLFNLDMMDDLLLEYPYQLVKDGKWTLDKMQEYIQAAANLNGDPSFRYLAEGNAVYGMDAHKDFPGMMLCGSDVTMYDRADDGTITLTFGGEKLYTAIEKINEVMRLENGHAGYDTYKNIFRASRSLFLGCELKELQYMREFEDRFGLLPIPKYDESQDGYRVPIAGHSELLIIPVTQKDPAKAGFILDALTYESKERVLPVFYDVTLSQKNLRDDESIEMLEIVWENRVINLLDFYGLDTLSTPLGRLVSGGNVTNASSLVAQQQTVMQQKLEEFLEKMQ